MLLTLTTPVPVPQVLAAGANAVAAVRSPKTAKDLHDLKLQYPEALTIVTMDAGDFPTVKVWPGLPAAASSRHPDEGLRACCSSAMVAQLIA